MDTEPDSEQHTEIVARHWWLSFSHGWERPEEGNFFFSYDLSRLLSFQAQLVEVFLSGLLDTPWSQAVVVLPPAPPVLPFVFVATVGASTPGAR